MPLRRFIFFSKKHKAITKLENKSTIEIKAYNEIADKCYKTLKKGNTVFIQGKINSKMEIEIEQIYSVYEEGIWKKN